MDKQSGYRGLDYGLCYWYVDRTLWLMESLSIYEMEEEKMGEINTVTKQEIYKLPLEGYLYVERHCHSDECATRSDVLISTVTKKEASECMDLHEKDAKPVPGWPDNEICIGVEQMQESIYIMLETAFEDIPEEVSKDYELIGKIQKAVEQNLKKQMESR